MKGHAEILNGLSALVQIQNTSLAQLRIHRNMCSVWGFITLNKVFSDHFEQLSQLLDSTIARLLQMEKAVDLQNLGRLNVGQTVEEILGSDRNMAYDVRAFALRLAQLSQPDLGSVLLAQEATLFEEKRIFFFDQSLELMRQLGVQNFLATRC